MKKTVAAWAVLLALMQPAAALCLATGEDLEVGAAAAIVMEAETGEAVFAGYPPAAADGQHHQDYDGMADAGAAGAVAGIHRGR